MYFKLVAQVLPPFPAWPDPPPYWIAKGVAALGIDACVLQVYNPDHPPEAFIITTPPPEHPHFPYGFDVVPDHPP